MRTDVSGKMRRRNTAGAAGEARAKHAEPGELIAQQRVIEVAGTDGPPCAQHLRGGSDPPENGRRLHKRAFRGGRSRDLSLQEGRVTQTAAEWSSLGTRIVRRGLWKMGVPDATTSSGGWRGCFTYPTDTTTESGERLSRSPQTSPSPYRSGSRSSNSHPCPTSYSGAVPATLNPQA